MGQQLSKRHRRLWLAGICITFLAGTAIWGVIASVGRHFTTALVLGMASGTAYTLISVILAFRYGTLDERRAAESTQSGGAEVS